MNKFDLIQSDEIGSVNHEPTAQDWQEFCEWCDEQEQKNKLSDLDILNDTDYIHDMRQDIADFEDPYGNRFYF